MLVLFDLDDTLLDHKSADRKAATCLYENIGSQKSLPEFLTAWDTAQERHYARYSAGEISFQEQRRERLREVIDPTLTDTAADRIFAQFVAAYEANWLLFDDVLPCLNRLYTHRIGIITNGDGKLQRRKMANAGISDRFDCVVISSECGYSKPDEKIFQYACELAGEKSESAIYIGDRYDLDAQAARQAGLRGIWLDRKSKSSQEHAPPIIASLDEFMP